MCPTFADEGHRLLGDTISVIVEIPIPSQSLSLMASLGAIPCTVSSESVVCVPSVMRVWSVYHQ